MKKSDELRKLVAAQRAKVEQLQAAEQYDDAAKEAEGLNALTRDLSIALAMEASDLAKFQNIATSISAAADPGDVKAMHNRAFNKAVLGSHFNFGQMTDSESAYVKTLRAEAGTPGQVGATPAKGGYLIPDEQMATIREFRRSKINLKDYCSVIPVTSRKGNQPTIGEEDGLLTDFDELKAINQSDIDFGQLTFDVHSCGDIIPVANALLEDINVNLTSLIGQRFAKKAVNTENAKILAIVNAMSKTAITSYKGINACLNKTLDPAISIVSNIFTNQDGLDYLDELEKTNGEPLLTPDLTQPGALLYRGRRIVTIKNTLFETDAIAGIPFLVGSMADFINFYERKGVMIAISTEAGFTMDATLLRAIERFGVGQADSEAMAFLTYKA